MKEYLYPTMARVNAFNIITGNMATLWFDTFAEALAYADTNGKGGEVLFSPIVVTEVSR